MKKKNHLKFTNRSKKLKFEKKNYLFAIPQEDILRVEKLVQNPGWGIE